MAWDRGKCFEALTNEYFYRSGHANLRRLFEGTSVALCESVFSKIGSPYWFTDHGVDHSDHVLYFALQIAKIANECTGRLSEIEAMALASACYLHDLAMAYVPENFNLSDGWSRLNIEEIRLWHVKAVGEVLSKRRSELGPLYEWNAGLEETLPIVCLAHGTDYHKAACKKFSRRSAHYGEFRGDLLGKVLLLADELDIGEHRSMIGRNPQFDQFPTLAKAHQFKHHYVIDLDVQLPRIRILFAFPETMVQRDRDNFKKWTCQKLQQQIELICEGLVVQYQRVFDVIIQPEEQGNGIVRKECTPAINKEVASIAQRGKKQDRQLGKPVKVRPNHFYHRSVVEREQGPLYPVLDTLMDDFFRECNKADTMRFFDDIYVRIPENMKVGQELIERVRKYCRAIKATSWDRLPSYEPFVIAGPTGAGKSALLLHLDITKRLRTRFSPLNSRLIVVYLDCLNVVNFVQILREMLRGLTEQCINSKRVWLLLKNEGWDKKLRTSKIHSLKESDARSLLDGVLRTLNHRSSGNNRNAIPTCFVLDNLDRVPGFDLKRKAVLFAARQAKKGYPFFVITLRYGTKKKIDDQTSELAAIPTHDIRSAGHKDVLLSRLDAAFSKKVLRSAESWSRRVEVNALLGKVNLTFHDLRMSIKAAMETLITTSPKAGEAFIPSMSGNNIRNALTLFRAIMKSVDEKELLILCQGETRQHSLIRFAMLERYPVYLERHSKIRNMFGMWPTDFYFVKLYLLRFLMELQRGPEGDNYVNFDHWYHKTLNEGIPERVFMKEAWDLMSKNLSLIEVEGTDGMLPDDRVKHIEDLSSDVGLRVNSVGNYYLSWLIFDTSYLRCVLQDTLMDVELARELGQPQWSISIAIEHVRKFLNFLQRKETEERITWGISEQVRRFIPDLKKRFELQENALLYEERNRKKRVVEKIPIATLPTKDSKKGISRHDDEKKVDIKSKDVSK